MWVTSTNLGYNYTNLFCIGGFTYFRNFVFFLLPGGFTYLEILHSSYYLNFYFLFFLVSPKDIQGHSWVCTGIASGRGWGTIWECRESKSGQTLASLPCRLYSLSTSHFCHSMAACFNRLQNVGLWTILWDGQMSLCQFGIIFLNRLDWQEC